MFNALDILYMVLAIILLPIGTLIAMILYRTYKMMDRIERILSFADRIIWYTADIEKIPMMLLEKFLGK